MADGAQALGRVPRTRVAIVALQDRSLPACDVGRRYVAGSAPLEAQARGLEVRHVVLGEVQRASRGEDTTRASPPPRRSSRCCGSAACRPGRRGAWRAGRTWPGTCARPTAAPRRPWRRRSRCRRPDRKGRRRSPRAAPHGRSPATSPAPVHADRIHGGRAPRDQRIATRRPGAEKSDCLSPQNVYNAANQQHCCRSEVARTRRRTWPPRPRVVPAPDTDSGAERRGGAQCPAPASSSPDVVLARRRSAALRRRAARTRWPGRHAASPRCQ